METSYILFGERKSLCQVSDTDCNHASRLALPYGQTDDYLKYLYKTFVQQQMEKEAETHIRALD